MIWYVWLDFPRFSVESVQWRILPPVPEKGTEPKILPAIFASYILPSHETQFQDIFSKNSLSEVCVPEDDGRN